MESTTTYGIVPGCLFDLKRAINIVAIILNYELSYLNHK